MKKKRWSMINAIEYMLAHCARHGGSTVRHGRKTDLYIGLVRTGDTLILQVGRLVRKEKPWIVSEAGAVLASTSLKWRARKYVIAHEFRVLLREVAVLQAMQEIGS